MCITSKSNFNKIAQNLTGVNAKRLSHHLSIYQNEQRLVTQQKLIAHILQQRNK